MPPAGLLRRRGVYLLGGLGYPARTSRQLAIGPTSAISLMIAGTVAVMAEGDAQRYAQIASLTDFTVAALCLLAWALRLSALVKLISDSILVGFKAGAGLTIAMTQLPSLLGVGGGGHNFSSGPCCSWERSARSICSCSSWGRRDRPAGAGRAGAARTAGGARRVALSIVAASVFGLSALGVPITGDIPAGLPDLGGPALRLRDVEGILPLAGGCLLLAYIEGVSAARTFAAKHGYALDSRQELLGIGAANLAAALGHGYPVAGGLSQSAVNDKAGARTPLALVFASITLALCLLFLTGLEPASRAAAVVLTAIYGLLDFPAPLRMWHVSRLDFYAAAIALIGVLLLDTARHPARRVGVRLAAVGQRVKPARRLPGGSGTNSYSDLARHPENEALPGVLAFRPEVSLMYAKADAILNRS
jgi:MFS superfamily sulfate permease-like transporter